VGRGTRVPNWLPLDSPSQFGVELSGVHFPEFGAAACLGQHASLVHPVSTIGRACTAGCHGNACALERDHSKWPRRTAPTTRHSTSHSKPCKLGISGLNLRFGRTRHLWRDKLFVSCAWGTNLAMQSPHSHAQSSPCASDEENVYLLSDGNLLLLRPGARHVGRGSVVCACVLGTEAWKGPEGDQRG
jgi:hypothetical protein